ncbi:hypothetical protein NJB1728e18_39970 [Mycobacterium marinum]|nr:hypothetical protein NJB1907E90_14410 [Mycobacterium marinum]GJO20327.1 hypothetical protein NJB1907E11_27650 [Mycobacterium marinum]GJO28167.1 hypothetical protein NJB1728e18_39970 [Mycobacterium marinum]GJO32917.1 hypothetical protein NJB1907f22_34160 [Mycobacterium marinum]GJO74319.1 hypothetical protein NJB1907E49_06380 [Mycobacterium marinum]
MTDTPAPPLFARGPKGNKLKVQPIVPQLSNTAAEGVVRVPALLTCRLVTCADDSW